MTEMSIGDLKLIMMGLTLTTGSVFCIWLSPCLCHTPHSHSEQTRLRPSLGIILCSIYFLGSRDAAHYINTEQRFKELGIWEEILYRVNSIEEQVTHNSLKGHHHCCHFPRLSQLCFYLERGGMCILHSDWSHGSLHSHVAISGQSRSSWPVSHTSTQMSVGGSTMMTTTGRCHLSRCQVTMTLSLSLCKLTGAM